MSSNSEHWTRGAGASKNRDYPGNSGDGYIRGIRFFLFEASLHSTLVGVHLSKERVRYAEKLPGEKEQQGMSRVICRKGCILRSSGGQNFDAC
jgi:hypothetical protein